jgi:hypothetical protein
MTKTLAREEFAVARDVYFESLAALQMTRDKRDRLVGQIAPTIEDAAEVTDAELEAYFDKVEKVELELKFHTLVVLNYRAEELVIETGFAFINFCPLFQRMWSAIEPLQRAWKLNTRTREKLLELMLKLDARTV